MKMHISLSPSRRSHQYGDFITVLEDPVANKERTNLLVKISHERSILGHEFLIGHTGTGEISHMMVENNLTQLWSLVKTERLSVLKRDALVERGVCITW